MDAPQISTLPEEGSPEPQQAPARVPKPPRVKLRLSEGKPPVASTSSSLSKQVTHASDDDDDDDDDEEEDQLIDDDDDDVRPPPTITIPVTLPPPPPTTPAVSTTRGTGPRRGVGRGRGGGRKRGAKADAPSKTTITVPPMINTTVEGWNASPSGSAASAPSTTGRKRGGPGSRGGVAQRAIRKRGSRGGKGMPVVPRDDAGSISEAYAGTAASSPMPHDDHSPEPDIHSASLLNPAPVEIDMNLEGVPLPVYPLPTKPFPVQPPPKIGTGIAPPIILDKGGKPVRKWRQANREIRGIAGGRWFAKAWIGDKESEFASAQAASSIALQNAAAAAMLLDRDHLGGVMLPSMTSISMPGTGKSTPRGKAAKAAMGFATAQSSRAASVVPDSISAQLPPAKKQRLNIPVTPGIDTPMSISTPGP